jgi:predicted N-acyltransferase
LSELGFFSARTEPTSRLALAPEGGLDGYLGSLRQSPRSDLTRHGRRARRLGATVSWEKDDCHVEALAGLVRDVCEKHGAPVSYPLATMRSIFRRLGPRLHLGSLWHDGRMLGAMLSVAHGDALWGWIAGLDYMRNREFGTYYALYLLSIERALQLGVSRLEAGRGQYRIKVRLGFTPNPVRAWLRPGPAYDAGELERGIALLDRCTDAEGKVRTAYREANLTPPDC